MRHIPDVFDRLDGRRVGTRARTPRRQHIVRPRGDGDRAVERGVRARACDSAGLHERVDRRARRPAPGRTGPELRRGCLRVPASGERRRRHTVPGAECIVHSVDDRARGDERGRETLATVARLGVVDGPSVTERHVVATGADEYSTGGRGRSGRTSPRPRRRRRRRAPCSRRTGSGGRGTLGIGTYRHDPFRALPSATGRFFGASLSSGSTLTSLTITACGVAKGTTIRALSACRARSSLPSAEGPRAGRHEVRT